MKVVQLLFRLVAQLADILILTWLLIKGTLGIFIGDTQTLMYLGVASLWCISINASRIYRYLSGEED